MCPHEIIGISSISVACEGYNYSTYIVIAWYIKLQFVVIFNLYICSNVYM